MTRLARLKRDALEATTFRGHRMCRWESYSGGATAKCRRCNRSATVETRPAPNSIDIHGEAIALGCQP